jgi:hypothetical protein
VDREKCKRWGVSVSDVNNVINSAVRGQAFTQMIEGEKFFDIAIRWPENRRQDLSAILDIPVDITNNQVTPGSAPGQAQTLFTGPSTGPVTSGMSTPYPVLGGNQFNSAYINPLPRVPLRELLTPLGANDLPDPKGHFVRPGVAIIYREQGKRFIPVKFSVQGRDLASAVGEAQEKTLDLFPPGAAYRPEWSGEFEEMEAAERRLLFIVPTALALIFVLLYMAFHSLLDALVILSNVLALSLGGIWALLLTGENFSISAAVGFISLFGVAIMDGLLSISYFNHHRLLGLSVNEAILQGAEKRVRPMMMTALTAVCGLFPAAVSTEIGAQTQRPLAIVVVGGMLTTLILSRYLLPVLYSYYGHRAREKPQEERAVLAPADTQALPNVFPEEIFGIVQYLHEHGHGEEIIRIADNTNKDFAHVMIVVGAAELLGFVKTEQQMAHLTQIGKKLVEATPDTRKGLWRDQLVKLPLFKDVFDVIQRQPGHAVEKDFVLETIVLRMPYEDYERVFDTFITWARYGDLFVYDEATEMIACAPPAK